MFFILSKIIAYLLLPINWVFLLFLGHIVFKKKKWRKSLVPFGIFLLIFFSSPLIFNLTANFWEGEAIAVKAMPDNFDYIILLGGFSNYHKGLDYQYMVSERGNRLIASLQLYKEGKASKIIVSGGSGNIWENRISEAILTRDFLIQIGIPPEDILVESNSRNTYENALFTKQLLDKIQTGAKCILVTSAFHMPRAKALFDKQGVDVTAYPTDFTGNRLNQPKHIFVPSGSVLWKWEFFIKEWVGILVYKIKGDL